VLPDYDDALLAVNLFPEWYVGQHQGIALEGGLADKLGAVPGSGRQPVRPGRPPMVCDLRLHARNLMVSPTAARWVLDFQDAV
jgi:aminoglycoside/choline kinase family phosphotransferase